MSRRPQYRGKREECRDREEWRFHAGWEYGPNDLPRVQHPIPRRPPREVTDRQLAILNKWRQFPRDVDNVGPSDPGWPPPTAETRFYVKARREVRRCWAMTHVICDCGWDQPVTMRYDRNGALYPEEQVIASALLHYHQQWCPRAGT